MSNVYRDEDISRVVIVHDEDRYGWPELSVYFPRRTKRQVLDRGRSERRMRLWMESRRPITPAQLERVAAIGAGRR